MDFPAIDPVKTGDNITKLRKAAGLSVHDVQAAFGFNSPRGGNGTVLTSSDVVVMPAGLEPGITSLRGLRPVRLDEGTIYGDPRRI